MNAYDYVSSRVKFLPIPDRTVREICTSYRNYRELGYDHGDARRLTLKSYSSIWITVAWLALQIIFYLLKQWWERRADIRPPV